MHAARALLQDSPIGVCASNRFISIGFHTLRAQCRPATPSLSITCALFPIQRQHSTAGGGPPLPILASASTVSRELSTVDSLNSFRMRSSKQTPCFARFWPKLSVRKSFRMRSYANRGCNSFRMRSSEKRWGGGVNHRGVKALLELTSQLRDEKLTSWGFL